ncbi:hypothetical protein Patl1_22515 [Pistacia atlantica]|uniref:Uncharacterized protein n=1 Tax=Pistacia atlantica TaxID=434234 RepID=A0ACC0ZTN6_9ROSI|nr:hypothetical protein Patl1_22515 [Pistacia atlantica]
MGREGIQNIQLVEGNSSNLQANFTDQGSRKGKLQSAVPVPNYEYQIVPLDLSASEDVSIWSTLWRVVKGYLSWVLFKWSTPTLVFHRICCLRGNIMFMLYITWRRVTESINWRLALVFISFCSVRDIDWHDHREMFSLFLFQFSVLLSRYAFVFEPKIEILISGAVLRLLCYTLIVTELLFEKKPSSEPAFDLGYQNKELTYSSFVFTMQRVDEVMKIRLPGNKCLVMVYLHHKYNKRAIAVLFLILEAISCLLDFTGKGKLVFIVAALVLALLVFFPTLWVYFKERSTRLPDERPIANVELLFSGIQLLTTLLHLTFELKGVYDKYNLSFLPLAFAFYRVFSAVSAFRKEHENGIYNAAEPPAENQVNQHVDHEILWKLRDETSLAEKVLWGDRPRWDVLYLDISNAAHYLREDEISWGFSGAIMALFSLKLTNAVNSAWLPGKYSSPEKKSVKSLIYIGAVERTCLSRCCGGAADLEVLNRLMRWQLEKAQQAPVVARSVASEVKRAGVVDTASGIAKSVYTKYKPTAKELYSKYEPKAEQCAVSTWRKLNQLPLFPQVAQVFVPTAAYCSEKYNETVLSTAEKGYRVSTYLPLVPTKRIAKVFSNEVAESQPLVSAGHETDVSVL